ncbi:MAG: rod shape-determining protein MreC [Chloroflexota bacterium]
MTSLLASRAARRRGIIFTVLVAVTLLLMAFSSNPYVIELQKGVSFAFAPIQRSLDTTAGSVAGFFRTIGEIDRLQAENSALRQENERLRADGARLDEIRRENDLLTSLLQLRTGFDYKTLATAVIARESSEFRRSVTVDRGSNDGVAEGDVVVGGGGALAGRVTEVGPNYSKITLLTDTTSKVIGQASPSAATGQVTGQLGGVLVMSNIDASEQVALGDEVVTAGIELGGGIRSPYPKGLLIGQVVDVRRDANDVVQTAYLQPAADPEKIEYLLVVLDYEGGLPSAEEHPVECGRTGGTLPDGEQPCFTPSPRTKPTSTPSPPPLGASHAPVAPRAP